MEIDVLYDVLSGGAVGDLACDTVGTVTISVVRCHRTDDAHSYL
jgi:hypothetical protein